MSMNINAPKGTKVVFTGKGGYEFENKIARGILEIGKVYTVESTNVNPYNTNVILEEVTACSPSRIRYSFNSVMFVEESEYKPDESKAKEWHSKSSAAGFYEVYVSSRQDDSPLSRSEIVLLMEQYHEIKLKG
jgi:hypothetical protein